MADINEFVNPFATDPESVQINPPDAESSKILTSEDVQREQVKQYFSAVKGVQMDDVGLDAYIESTYQGTNFQGMGSAVSDVEGWYDHPDTKAYKNWGVPSAYWLTTAKVEEGLHSGIGGAVRSIGERVLDGGVMPGAPSIKDVRLSDEQRLNLAENHPKIYGLLQDYETIRTRSKAYLSLLHKDFKKQGKKLSEERLEKVDPDLIGGKLDKKIELLDFGEHLVYRYHQ